MPHKEGNPVRDLPSFVPDSIPLASFPSPSPSPSFFSSWSSAPKLFPLPFLLLCVCFLSSRYAAGPDSHSCSSPRRSGRQGGRFIVQLLALAITFLSFARSWSPRRGATRFQPPSLRGSPSSLLVAHSRVVVVGGRATPIDPIIDRAAPVASLVTRRPSVVHVHWPLENDERGRGRGEWRAGCEADRESRRKMGVDAPFD
jgi:hypothetical protein